MTRALLIAALALTVGGALGGCSKGPSISAKVSGPTNGSIVSDVRCASQSSEVTVTGTVTKNTVDNQTDFLTYQGLQVSVYDSAGHEIGSTPKKLGSMDIETNGQFQRFYLTVPVRGTPSVCDVDWNAGYPPGVGNQA